jgi:hypothetical protein
VCRLLTVVVLAAYALPASAQSDSARRILSQFEDAKPDANRLAFYSLDWAMNLKEAKARAVKEGRPILVVLNTNITAGTNFFSGHT